MNIPVRKSLTTVWAPKPIATPTIEVPAMNGARLTRSSLRMSRKQITKIVADVADFSTELSVAARCARRSESNPDDSRNDDAWMRSLKGRSSRGVSPRTGLTARSMVRRARDRTTSPMKMMTTMRIGASMRTALWSSQNRGRASGRGAVLLIRSTMPCPAMTGRDRPV